MLLWQSRVVITTLIGNWIIQLRYMNNMQCYSIALIKTLGVLGIKYYDSVWVINHWYSNQNCNYTHLQITSCINSSSNLYRWLHSNKSVLQISFRERISRTTPTHPKTLSTGDKNMSTKKHNDAFNAHVFNVHSFIESHCSVTIISIKVQ